MPESEILHGQVEAVEGTPQRHPRHPIALLPQLVTRCALERDIMAEHKCVQRDVITVSETQSTMQEPLSFDDAGTVRKDISNGHDE